MAPAPSGPLAPAHPPASARCGRHPDVAAVDLCQRCGAFLCGNCVELLGESVYCPDCYQRLGGDAPPSRLARVAFVLGLIAFLTGFVPGVLGLILARLELRRIDEGDAPESGRILARRARLLGWIHVAILVLLFLILAAFVFLVVRRNAS